MDIRSIWYRYLPCNFVVLGIQHFRLVCRIYLYAICFKKINRYHVLPICPIYGFGALFVYFTLNHWKETILHFILSEPVLATAVELVAAKLMIRYTGCVWWDYSEKPFNYKGILCLESTIAWGFYTVGMFGFLHKMVMAFTDKIGVTTGKIIGMLLATYYVIAFIKAICSAKDMGEMPGIQMVKMKE